MEVVNSDDEKGTSFINKNSKKRQKTGRLSEVNKKLRLQSQEEGPSCQCKRFKCFEVISAQERSKILACFNSMGS